VAKFWDEAKLKYLVRQKQPEGNGGRLGDYLGGFLRPKLVRRQQELAAANEAWGKLLPEELAAHSSVQQLRGGELRVQVDSAVHLYELRLLVHEGLAGRLCEICPGVGIWRIKLVRGVCHQGKKPRAGGQQ